MKFFQIFAILCISIIMQKLNSSFKFSKAQNLRVLYLKNISLLKFKKKHR